MTHSINWFLGISVAAHMALLLAWQSSTYTPGHTGHALQLSVIQRSGDSNEPPSPLTETPAPAVPDTAELSKQPVIPPTRVAAPLTVVQKTTPHPVHKAAPKPSPAVTQPARTTASPATMASHSVLQQQQTDHHLRNSVMELITQKLTYPAIARRKGWQGIVKLGLHIEADGSITGLQVDETSGYSILDQAAMQCLQLASLPDAAQWLQGQAIDIVVPVEYRLIDS